MPHAARMLAVPPFHRDGYNGDPLERTRFLEHRASRRVNTPDTSSPHGSSAGNPLEHCSLGELLGYFLRLGALGFGGPVALIGYMHRDLVERRGWFSEADYKEGLTLAQLAPGPLAVQLAIYLGYLRAGTLGATLVGIVFCLPSFVVVVALGWGYQQYGGLRWVQAVFYGVGPVVIGIIAASAARLTQSTAGRDRLLWAILSVSAICTAVTESEYVLLFLCAGVLVWLLRGPRWFRPGTSPAASLVLSIPASLSASIGIAGDYDASQLWRMTWFFAKAGAFVFGSGLAIVPFLYGGVVTQYAWLDDAQFLDAVAVAMITPGPIVITVGFIGYLVAGLAGALVVSVATFLPCYLFTIVPAPLFRRYGSRRSIVMFVDGVTAAAVGAICGAVVVLGRRTLVSAEGGVLLPKLVLLAAAIGVLAGRWRVAEPLLVLAAALVGLAIYPYVGN